MNFYDLGQILCIIILLVNITNLVYITNNQYILLMIDI